MSAAPSALSASGLTVAYGSIVALEDVTIEVPRGVTVAVLGPNGSGKSTLFAAGAGLVSPRHGAVSVDGSLAFLPQHMNVDPTFPVTVRDVVRMGRWGGLGPVRRFRDSDHEHVEAALEALRVGDIAERRIQELSGGQRQRALLAQVMAQDADVLFLDEPLTGVDRPTADAVGLLLDRWRSEGRAVLVATHDLEAAARDHDLVLALNRRVIGYGPPQRVCTEPVLRETFGGHLARVGDLVVDTEHTHDHAG